MGISLTVQGASFVFDFALQLPPLLDRAAEQVLEEILQSGSERLIMARDIQTALKQTRPTTLEWLEAAKNYVEFANATGQYDELKEYLGKNTTTADRVLVSYRLISCLFCKKSICLKETGCN